MLVDKSLSLLLLLLGECALLGHWAPVVPTPVQCSSDSAHLAVQLQLLLDVPARAEPLVSPRLDKSDDAFPLGLCEFVLFTCWAVSAPTVCILCFGCAFRPCCDDSLDCVSHSFVASGLLAIDILDLGADVLPLPTLLGSQVLFLS